MKYKVINKCQICEKKLYIFLNLGKQPLCDDLTKKPNDSKFYKLQVSYCKNCLTAFQKYNIEKKFYFQNLIITGLQTQKMWLKA